MTALHRDISHARYKLHFHTDQRVLDVRDLHASSCNDAPLPSSPHVRFVPVWHHLSICRDVLNSVTAAPL